jgi:hypothetical protein
MLTCGYGVREHLVYSWVPRSLAVGLKRPTKYNCVCLCMQQAAFTVAARGSSGQAANTANAKPQ